MLVNLKNQDSIKAATRQGGGALVDELNNVKNSIAFAEVGGRRVVISVDRILDRVRAEGLDLDDPEDRQKVEEYIERVVVHEVGHTLGLCHEDPCGSKAKRGEGELMKGETSFASRLYRDKSQNDLDKMMNSLEKRVE